MVYTFGDMTGAGSRAPRRCCYVFYGGDLREAYLPWLREQVASMATLTPADDDGDLPIGLFVISDERAAVDVWEVRDGMVHERRSPELAWVSRQ